jgi:phage terminase large subunit
MHSQEVKADTIVNPHHYKLFQSTSRELVVRGGTSAGKTYSIVDKLILLSAIRGYEIKGLVVRKSLPRIKNSIIPVIEKRAKAFGQKMDINWSLMQAKVGNTVFVFQGVANKDDYERLRSITDLDFAWINELPEIREDDYEEIRRRVRGGNLPWKQIISDFNPINSFSWVYRRFYQENRDSVERLKYTIKDNHPDFLKLDSTKEYIKMLEELKEYNYNQYKVFFQGDWGSSEGLIYNWDTYDAPENADEIFYGLDFGYSVDPAAVVRIYRKSDEFWVESVLYKAGLTNEDLAKELYAHHIEKNAPIYCDQAEPKSIETLRRAGYNAKPCDKKEPVGGQVDYIKSKRIHIVDASTSIHKEHAGYSYKTDKDGKSLPEPVKHNDHAMDAIRYGIYTHCARNYPSVYTVKDFTSDQETYKTNVVDEAIDRAIRGLPVECSYDTLDSVCRGLQAKSRELSENGDIPGAHRVMNALEKLKKKWG